MVYLLAVKNTLKIKQVLIVYLGKPLRKAKSCFFYKIKNQIKY